MLKLYSVRVSTQSKSTVQAVVQVSQGDSVLYGSSNIGEVHVLSQEKFALEAKKLTCPIPHILFSSKVSSQ